MRGLVMVAVFGLGVVCGASVFGAGEAATPAEGKRAATDLARLSTQELGGVLMQRVGRSFVHDSRRAYPLEWGVEFYDEPKPFLHSLCRVDRFEVSQNIAKGRRVRDNHYWDDNLKVERLYGAWKRPSSPDSTAEEREAACAKFRDFGNLLSEKTILSAGRAFYLMDTAIERARTGKIDFSVTCRAQKMECNGVALLKSLDLKRLRQVRMIAETKETGLARRTDEISIAPATPDDPGRAYNVIITVQSYQMYGRHSVDEGEILAMDVRQEIVPFTPTAPPE